MIRQLYYGDNLEVLREHIANESVQLVYLDPPFKSQQDYNLLFRSTTGAPSEAQLRAFTDTWRWGREAEEAYNQILTDPHIPARVSTLVSALFQFLGRSEMMAYLLMMAPRLVELHRVLKPTGSLYLHCDPSASHYLKILLDAVFDPTNMINEIVWKRSQPKGHTVRRFSRCHDTILSYAKSPEYLFNAITTKHDPKYLKKFYRYKEEGSGRIYRLSPLLNPNKNRPNLTYEFPPGSGIVRVWRWTKERMMKAWEEGRIVIPPQGKVPSYKRYLDEMPGTGVTDLWTDIEHLHGSHKEKLGYPTQKPVALLRRIIEASSQEGDVVLDPFCGCGTALVAAEQLGRSWIGIDITYLAVDVMIRRLKDHFPTIEFEVIGDPKDVEGARALAEKDRFQFQSWVLLKLLSAQPTVERRSDRGIDGYINLIEGKDKYIRGIVQVKSGRVGVRDVRDLRGALEREGMPFAILATLEDPSPAMIEEANAAGTYGHPGSTKRIPRIQIITVGELLQGKRPLYPNPLLSPVPPAPPLEKNEQTPQQLEIDADDQDLEDLD